MEDFVILFHQMPDFAERPSHWDLMLRYDNQLLTWECQTNPLENQAITCQRLANHRLEYLKYEGEISDGRGSVKQIAKGKFEWITRLNDDNWKIRFVDVGNFESVAHMTNSIELKVFLQP